MPEGRLEKTRTLYQELNDPKVAALIRQQRETLEQLLDRMDRSRFTANVIEGENH